MADLEIGGLQNTYSTTKDARKNVGFYAGILGVRLVCEGLNFDAPSLYHLAYADSASSTGCEEGPTEEDLAAVRHLGRRVAERAAPLVGGRAHI